MTKKEIRFAMRKNKTVRIVKKNEVMSLLTVALVVMNILALVFTVVRGEISFLSGEESFYSNGFTLVFSGYPEIVEGCGNVLRVLSVLYLSLSLVLALWLAVFSLVKRSVDFGRLGVFFAVSSAVLSAFYMTLGIIAYSAANDYADLYYRCSTAAFWPFVFSALMTSAYFTVKYKMPSEIEF